MNGTQNNMTGFDRSVSWEFIVGMVQFGADAESVAAAIRRNDRVDPAWRRHVPDVAAPDSAEHHTT